MEKSIYQAINNVMKDIKPIAKGQKNTQQNYSFRGIDDAMNSLSPIMQKHGIFPAIVDGKDIESHQVTSIRGGVGYRTVKRYTIRFYATDGSYIDVISDGEAIDYGDKGSNKAMSVAYREALFKTFIIPFGNDDIENHNHDLQDTQKTAPKYTQEQLWTLAKNGRLICKECQKPIFYEEYKQGEKAGQPKPLKCQSWQHKGFQIMPENNDKYPF